MSILSTTRIFIYHPGFSIHEAEAENTFYTFVLVVYNLKKTTNI